MIRQALLYVVLLMTIGPARAGVVELHNGDRISGEFVRADETKVYWTSPLLGSLSFNKEDIANISSTRPLKIHGVRTPCLIQGMDDEHLVYICGGDPEERRVPLVSLAVITPYQHFIEGTYTYRGRVNLSGVYARGNDVRDDWKLNSNIEYRRHDWRHAMSVEYASYSVRRAAPDVKWSLRYGLDWFVRERWFMNNEIRLGSDELRALERYYNVGTGAGFQFWENSTTALSLTGGLLYVHELYPVPAEPRPDFQRDEERVAWRMGADFRYQLPMDVSLFHRSEFVGSSDSGSDWQLNSTTGVNTMLAGRLYSEVKIDYDVDNQPQANTERDDVRMHVGLGYEW